MKKMQKKIPCVEIKEQSFFAMLRSIGGSSRVRFAITQNPPSIQVQFGFPTGAKFLQADDIGLQYYASQNSNAEVVSESEFIAYCQAKWRL
jgi:hypothetical protein